MEAGIREKFTFSGTGLETYCGRYEIKGTA
jgi:hypothetical protein